MGLTTTYNEFLEIKKNINEIYRKAVTKCISLEGVGSRQLPYLMADIEELGIYVYILNSWDQDEFNYLGYNNYLNDRELRTIYTRARQLEI